MSVSVCIPTFNQCLYIEKAIQSCIEQTYPPIEIIVSNDNSTDETSAILCKLSEKYSILRVFNQPSNLGIIKNTNFLFNIAKGDFIVKLDSDDYLASNYIAQLRDSLLKYPMGGYAHAAVHEVDEHGSFRRKRCLARPTGFYSSDKALQKSIGGYQVAANIIMFRRSALQQVCFITAKTNFAEDYYLSVVLASNGFGNVYVDEVLSYYRVWSDTDMKRQKRKISEIVGLRQVFEEVIEPAFTHRGWSLKPIIASRANFTCSHSNCLGWKLYTKAEKSELLLELRRLSSSPKAKLISNMYLHNWGGILNIYQKVLTSLKAFIKTLCFFFLSKLRVFKS